MEIFFPTVHGVKSTTIDEDCYIRIRDFTLTMDSDGYVDCCHNSLPDGHKRLHRILMNLNSPDERVDHINRIRTDNRILNFRHCNVSQNSTNSSCNHLDIPTSKYRGVHTYRRTDGRSKFYARPRWRMSIKKNGKQYQKKCDFEIEAAMAYDIKAKELHGEFARLNFPDNESLMKACLELAQLKTVKYSNILAPSNVFGKDIPINGGSMGTPRPESTAKMLQSYAQYLPGVLQATNSQAVPTAQSQLAADQATAGGEANLNASLTAQYAPILAQINSMIQNQQTQSGSSTINSELTGAGGDAAKSASDLLAQTNPAYAKTIGSASTAAQNLVNSYNLNGLSPGETNAVERSTNQSNTATGNLGLSNPTNVVSNAMNFGDAFNAKRSALNTAIGTANQTAGTASAGFNPIGVATSQPSTSGLTQFQQSGTGASGAQGALSFGQGLLGNQFGQNNATIGAAASRANANSVPSFMGAMPSYS